MCKRALHGISGTLQLSKATGLSSLLAYHPALVSYLLLNPTALKQIVAENERGTAHPTKRCI